MKNFTLGFLGGLVGATLVAAALLYTSNEIYRLRFAADVRRVLTSSAPIGSPSRAARDSLQMICEDGLHPRPFALEEMDCFTLLGTLVHAAAKACAEEPNEVVCDDRRFWAPATVRAES